ncbi:Phosphoserine phosphatase [Piscirickettsia salmonis]|uniref:phosphoserine phosphatase n=1 Tax=Piscirickettsia salmonis TaxID=1238 RepID=A0A1L6TCN7_PISSA|nr:HAD-IB family phosphatase [Piscirickettsia salmonis]AKP74183.1 HAD family hydrolase [Piscirickettsia salmonis LF-89 = ATCC VR-1361]ALB23066.1 HAD phosphoserine phosphatase-like hydrolase, IB family protein [Piscirickettsia salmonis]ALY03002.1 HAD family hydrolase [Piscirickettsia salmonis]AMA42560.1 HAD family hydrolase [Piscirickettsia salmonis]AOS35030.1 HAD family hydrolase [Piscirickettsia salmonis]
MTAYYGTLLFDFDSTLIRCESLDLFFKITQNNPTLSKQIEHITHLGMAGEISFAESLSQRLALLNTTPTALQHFAKTLINYITPNMPELIAWAHHYFDIWIVSGGLTPLILPVAEKLNIDKSHVKAINLQWHDQHLHADPENGFATDKITGAKQCLSLWQTPITIIGDGYTDFQLFEANIAHYFIAYCQHVERANVITQTRYRAYQPAEIKQQLELLYEI